MNKKLVIFSIISLFLFIGCSENLFDLLSVVDAEPSISAPIIDHFAEEEVIIIKWDEDKYADEYILYRDDNPLGDFDKIIYQGTNLKYEDNDSAFTNGYFYYYKLAKKRGQKTYPKSNYSFTVFSNIKRDSYENNNLKDIDTHHFTSDLTANIYYYRDDYNNELKDKDWYKVIIGSNLFVSLLVKIPADTSNLADEEIMLNIESLGGQLISDNGLYEIRNTTDDTMEIYFQICVEETNFLNDIPNSPHGEGKFGFYELEFLGVYPIP